MTDADAPARFVAVTRDGRSVAIEVRCVPSSFGHGFVGHMWTRPTVDEALADALRQHACESPFVEVLAHGEPPRAQLLAERGALRAEAARLRHELALARGHLRTWGCHDADCPARTGAHATVACACGLAEALFAKDGG